MILGSTRRLAAGLILASLLAACGGGGGGAVGVAGSDPVATVNSLVATIQAKQFTKVADLACAQYKDSIASKFDPSQSLGGSTGASGVTAADILDAVNIEMTNVKVGAASVTGTTATVHLNADMKMTANTDKLKALIAKMMTAAGAPANDAAVNAAMSAASSSFSQTTTINSDIPLAQENGKWLVCGDLSSIGK